ncbi:MAG: response regulator [candidate division Zixibacteria bacterium]|nr:response regulator [candidate division Zixibacteria bacterium]
MTINQTEQPSILVVDDELLIRDLLYDFFKQQGWTIAVAENGEKALEILRARKIDLVLTDIKMPQIDGLTLTSQVRAKYPDMPVVLMTGYPSVETAVEGIRAKVSDYIIKPFNINKLFKTLKSQLDDSNPSSDEV